MAGSFMWYRIAIKKYIHIYIKIKNRRLESLIVNILSIVRLALYIKEIEVEVKLFRSILITYNCGLTKDINEM
jgi:hypothetical protein